MRLSTLVQLEARSSELHSLSQLGRTSPRVQSTKYRSACGVTPGTYFQLHRHDVCSAQYLPYFHFVCLALIMTTPNPATYYWMCGRCGVISTSESGLTTPWPRSNDSVAEQDVGSCTRPECQLLQLCEPLNRQQTGPSPIPDRPQHNSHCFTAVPRGGRLYRCDEHGRVLSELGILTDNAGMPIDADGHHIEIFGYDAFGRLLQDGNPDHSPPPPLPLPLQVTITHPSQGLGE